MSLDCQFLICPSVFSGVYIYDDLGYEPFLQNYIIHSTMFESKWLNICLYIGSELEFNVLHLLISEIQRFIHSGKHMLDGILSQRWEVGQLNIVKRCHLFLLKLFPFRGTQWVVYRETIWLLPG
jgi:hypothetical protein